MRRARSDGLALAGLIAACAAFFTPVLSGRFHLPWGGGDLSSFLFPMHRFLAARYAVGDLPLWNPYQDAGWPIAADVQAGMLYPPQVLLWLLRPDFGYDAMQAQVMLHVLWAGIAMYVCLRLWHPGDRLRPAAAWIGAMAWMLNDVFVTHLGNLNFVAVATWWPLALLGLHRATVATAPGARRGWLAVGAAALGVGTLAGHAQVTWLGAGPLLLYAGYHALAGPWRAGSPAAGPLAAGPLAAGRSLARRWRARAWPLVAVAVVGGLGAALAAIVLVPAALNAPWSARAGFSYAESLAYSLPPEGLVGLVAPGFWGRAAAFRGPWERVEVGYVGVLPWLLAAVAIVRLGARRTGPWLLLGALGLGLALGEALPLHRLLLAPLELPFRAPARYLLWTDLALSMLAALGMDHLLRAGGGAELRPVVRRLAWVAGGIVLTVAAWGLAEARQDPSHAGAIARAVAALALWAGLGLALLMAHARDALSRTWLAVLASLLLAADLVLLGAGVEVQREDPATGFHDRPVIQALDARSAEADQAEGAGSWRVDIVGGPLQPGAAQIYGLHALGGVYNPLRVATFDTAVDALGMRGSPLYDRFAVRWVVTAEGEAPTDLRQEPMVRVEEEDPTSDLWRNDEAAARVRWVAEAEIVEGGDGELLERVRRAGGREHVLLGEAPVGRRTRAEGSAATSATSSRAWVEREGTDEIVLGVAADRPGWVVLADVWHPGWRAWLDGAEVPVVRGDFTFRALQVPAGARRVVLRFEPPGWRWAMSTSVGAWLVVLGMAWSGRSIVAREPRPPVVSLKG